MNGDRPGKPPKPPLKAPQGERQFGGWPSLGRKDFKRKGVFNPFTCACTHAHTQTRTYTHAHIHARTRTHAHMRTHAHVRTLVRITMYARTRKQPYTYARTYATHAHTRSCTHVHMRTHAHMYARVHTHVGAAQRSRRPSLRHALCLLIEFCPPRIGRIEVN